MGSSSVSPLGAAAAVLLIMATVFLGRTAKGRRAARRASDREETSPGDPSLKERDSSNPAQEDRNHGDSSPEETEHSHPGANVRVPDIFLSHSGKQKPFVAHLYTALQSANHTAFFDQPTLPRGLPYPPQIEQAARGCKIGVVVLSEEFLTSKWPMIELEMLVLQRGPEPRVLPLFYELNPTDLKSPEKLSKWRPVWEELAGKDGAKQWEKAVKDLKCFSGEVYVQGTSQGALIDKIVGHICTLIPCHVPYDSSLIQGQSRLAQAIAEKFDRLDASQPWVIGLHGVGGLGKTTLCKVMVNYYSSQYCGRSCLIEFPSSGGGGDLSTIASECKKALNKLTDANEEHLLNKADSFDQVVQLMRDRVGRHDVFLAIDNVWESSLEAAKRVLRVGFSANSKILVTSRSEEVLNDLLQVRGRSLTNNHVNPLPAPEREEAFQIFQETFELYDLSASVDSSQINRVLESCRFSGIYHALALKALAKYAKRVCMTADAEGIEHHLSSVLEEISCEGLSDVQDAIRLNYDSLPEQKKHMFLDIVVFLQRCRSRYSRHTYADAQKWISSVHWLLPESKTTRLINELSFDGLIQLEDGEEIGVHDLYLELALREIARSPRLLIEGITESVERMEREQLEIVMLDGGGVGCPCPFERVQQCKWPKLKVLRARNIKTKSGIWLDSMPSLRDLALYDITLVENTSGSTSIDSGSVSGKEKVAHSHLLQPSEQVVPSMPSLDQEGTMSKNSRTGFVRGERLVDASCILHLNGSVQLRKLEVYGCSFVEEIVGLDALGNLGVLKVEACEQLRSLNGLSGLVELQALHVSRCGSLQNLPDVSGLTCLKNLELHGNGAMEEVGGEYVSSTLGYLEIVDCRSLRSFPSLGECMHLEALRTDCAEFKSLLQKFPNLHYTCLRRYAISNLSSTSKVVVDVGCLTNLERLYVFDCVALEEIEDLSALRCLAALEICACDSLKKLNVRCASLKMLTVLCCKALEEIVVKAPLESLDMSFCKSLKKVEGISSMDPRSVRLYDCGSLTHPQK